MTMQALRGGTGIAPNHFHLSTRRGGWSAPHPGSFISRNDLVPIAQEAGLALGPVWMVTKDLAPLGFDSWTDQPMASNYT